MPRTLSQNSDGKRIFLRFRFADCTTYHPLFITELTSKTALLTSHPARNLEIGASVSYSDVTQLLNERRFFCCTCVAALDSWKKTTMHWKTHTSKIQMQKPRNATHAAAAAFVAAWVWPLELAWLRLSASFWAVSVKLKQNEAQVLRWVENEMHQQIFAANCFNVN